MNGYATSARIRAVSPRSADAVGLAGGNGARQRKPWSATPRSRLRSSQCTEIEDLADLAPDARRLGAEIRDRLAGFSARCSRLPWFLLSPERWR